MENKKGFVNFIFGFLGIFILLLIITILLPVKYGNADLNESLTTINTLQDKFLVQFDVNSSLTRHPELTHPSVRILMDIVYKFINFVIYVSFEITKLAVIWGDQYIGTSGVWLLFWLIILSLLAPLVWILFKIIIVICILIKEKIDSNREKKELNKYRQI